MNIRMLLADFVDD